MKPAFIFAFSAVLVATAARAVPEPWEPGDDTDRLAVLAAAPGDETRFCAGILQEFDALDLPAHVFFAMDSGTDPAPLIAADAALDRPPDSFDILVQPANQLPALLPAFAPSHLVLTQPVPSLLDIVSAAFPDPSSQPVLLVPAGDPGAADFLFALTPAQAKAKARAIQVYGLPPPSSDSEAFLELEFDPYSAAVAAIAPPPPAPSAEETPPPEVPMTADPAPDTPPPSRLVPRTRLPAAQPPPARAPVAASWADEPVFW